MKHPIVWKILLILLISAAAVLTVLRGKEESRPIASGILERDRVELPARAPEQILRVSVREGDKVEEGDILLQQSTTRAEAYHQEAKANRDQLKARLELLKKGAPKEGLDMAEAALSAAEAQLTLSRLALEDLTIRAPRAGMVDSLPLKAGATPLTGQPLVVLLTGEKPYARVYIPEEWHGRLKPGDTLPVRADGFDKEFTGILERVSPDPVFTPYFALNQNDRGHLSYIGKISLTDPETENLAPGTPVTVLLDGKTGGKF